MSGHLDVTHNGTKVEAGKDPKQQQQQQQSAALTAKLSPQSIRNLYASSARLSLVLGGGSGHRRQLPTASASASAALTAPKIKVKGTSTEIDEGTKNEIDEGTKNQARSKRKRSRGRQRSIVRDKAWCTHQSVATVCERNGGYCQYSLCPGLNRKNNARKRPFPSTYRCHECSIRLGKDFFLCNTVKKGEAILCHMKYHTQMAENEQPRRRR